jgi:hypothetical protein
MLNQNTHNDLASLYNSGMECQVNVAQDLGEAIQGKFEGKSWTGYTDGDQTWKPFRIPYNANSTPEYDVTTPMNFDLAEHAEAIGMTGWDWQNCVSRWVAFDFDAIVGHSDKHSSKLSVEDLVRVKQAACDIPWVTVRHSTGGRGLHLYVFLDPVSTANHTEHQALARSILSLMSGIARYDFASKVDICGGNMWIWHRKMQKSPQALDLIKQGKILKEIPANWRDHIAVMKGNRKKIKQRIPASEELPELHEKFDQTAGQQNLIALDLIHKKLIDYLHQNCSRQWWWDSDHHMLVTHTLDLKSAHEALAFKGIYETSSPGNDAEQNCFAFPMRQGAWSIRRYSLGASEHASWEQDGRGWTKCYLNYEPNLKIAALAHEGLERPSGGYAFNSLADAKEAGLAVGSEIKTPAGMDGRTATIKMHKDRSRIIVEIPAEHHDQPGDMLSWLREKNKWVRILNANLSNEGEVETESVDDFCRHIVTRDGGDAGWMIRGDEWWRQEPLTHVKLALKTHGYNAPEVDKIVGGNVCKPWLLTVAPFQSEYPGDRQWNKNAPQLKHVPSNNDTLSFPHWQMILDHVGKGLDVAVIESNWCTSNNIVSGSDYLKCWVASLFQYPLQPLPYLFIFSDKQNTGKSILHESLNLLFSPGYRRADHSLGGSIFNGELEGAILCVIEETNLATNKTANAKIKDWVTSPMLPIHKKMLTPYEVINTTHWIHCSNFKTDCPIWPGDTRITMINVPELPVNPIPKPVFMEVLAKEAPDFLAALLSLEIPASNDRLRLPVLNTQQKLEAAKINENLVEIFLREACHEAPGYMISLAKFAEAYIAWLDPSERIGLTKRKISSSMPDRIPKGRNPYNAAWSWGNISFKVPDETRSPLICFEEKLVSKEM